MIKAIIIDDEVHCLETLEILIKDYCPEIQIVAQCTSGKQGLAAIAKYQPDIVFLDVEMPAMTGFDLLEELNEIHFALVFTTGHNQYAIKAIRFSALDYLLKPIDPDELVQAVIKVKEQRHLPVAEQFQMLLNNLNGKSSALQKIAVPTAEGFELIPSSDVIYLKADNNYTHIMLKSKQRILACRTLKDMQEQLKPYPFFVRVHNSYLVNLNEVGKYVRGDGGYLVLSDGSTVSVSRSRKDDLLKMF